MIKLDTIYNEDCLEGMKRIPDGSIDAVICDLPYGTTACAWDSVIPFDKLWEQYRRITKPNAAIVLFGSEPFSSALRMSNIKEYRYDWVWDKINQATGFLNAYKMPMKVHENISVFYREQSTYNPQMRQGTEPNHYGKNPAKGFSNVYNISTTGKRDKTLDKLPISCLHIEKDHPSKTIHPTQKPVDLLRYLVLTYTNEGDTVLDNCMGSGTTAIACIKEKRHFIGFELSKEYFDKAQRRIKAEQAQLTLF